MTLAKRVKPSKKKPSTTSSSRIPPPGEKNVPPDELVGYCFVVYGQKGIGKTTLLSQLTDKTLVCDFEDREDTKVRRVGFPSRTIDDLENGESDPWKDFKSVVDEADQSDEVDCIVVDSIDLAYEACLNSVCHDEGCRHPGEVNDYGTTWKLVKEEFRSTMEAIRKSPNLGLVFTSHCNEDRMELNTGSKEQLKKLTVYSPSCSKAAQEYLRQSCAFAIFYGKHLRHRALHFRWEDNIWTACSNDDVFRDSAGKKISALHVPDARKAGEYLQAAFKNKPISEVLVYWEEEENEEEPQPKKKFRKTA